ncbi:MAG TPA: translation initiation factor IF-3 [Demequinaceae bacterium]
MKGADINEPRINDKIRVPEVRLVGPEGEQVGIVRLEDALRLAQEADLDLVEVAPESRPPVAKLMDYGKFKYEAAVKAREARRNQSNTVVKEIRFRLKIDPHDYETKKGHVVRFLKAGDKVKVTIMFRGREQSRPDAGRRLLQRLAEDVADLSIIEHAPVQEGRNMSLVLGPVRKKAEARDEARREREAKVAAETAEREAKKAPKTDAAKVAAAKAANPKPSATKADAPKADAPKADAPVANVASPADDAPAAAKATVAKPAVAKPAVAKVPISPPTTAKAAPKKTSGA